MKMISNLIRELRKVTLEGLAPPSNLNLVDWADQNRMLSPESSSQPGKWKTSKVEVARGPMMAITEKGIHTITVMSCTQLMKTELINNIVGYFIHQDPSPMIVMQPTGKLAEAWSKDRLDKMLRDTPVLKGKVKDKRLKDAENTILHKAFPGGHITVVGSNSPADLAMRPVRIVLCDETDKYPASSGDEGDPIKLVSERSATFWNRLKVHVCSPTNEGTSRVAIEYENSDQRKYHVACPHCSQSQVMEWKGVQWPKDKPEEAFYYCVHCGAEWSEPERVKAIEKGVWKATKPFNGHAGFHATKLNSPWESIGELAVKFVEAKNKQTLLKTFINTQLAETWKEKAEVPDWKRLHEYRETYKQRTVPERGLFLTQGVDVQKDRLEVQVRAWGRDKENWLVDYLVFEGDTSSDDVWLKMEKQIYEKYQHESEQLLPISMTAIDSGYNTQMVYKFCRKFGSSKVLAVKGSDTSNLVISAPSMVDVRKSGKKIRRGLRLYTVGVSTIKSELYGWLRQERPISESDEYPYGFCHHYQIDEEFFKQLTAERLVEKMHKGYSKYEWEKIRERNEALDTFVYARAAACQVGLDRFKNSEWQNREMLLGVKKARPQRENKPIVNNEKVVKTKKKKTKKRSVWDRRD